MVTTQTALRMLKVDSHSGSMIYTEVIARTSSCSAEEDAGFDRQPPTSQQAVGPMGWATDVQFAYPAVSREEEENSFFSCPTN